MYTLELKKRSQSERIAIAMGIIGNVYDEVENGKIECSFDGIYHLTYMALEILRVAEKHSIDNVDALTEEERRALAIYHGKVSSCCHPETWNCHGCEHSLHPEFYDGGCDIIYRRNDNGWTQEE